MMLPKVQLSVQACDAIRLVVHVQSVYSIISSEGAVSFFGPALWNKPPDNLRSATAVPMCLQACDSFVFGMLYC